MAELRHCYRCGSTHWIEQHHVFGGALRKKSTKYGAVVDLCHYCHNEPPDGVHFNAQAMLELKQEYQRKLMQENNWTISDFRREFYKNYLDDCEE